MTPWVLAFGIITADGQITRLNPRVEFPTLEDCHTQGIFTFLELRRQDWWAFFQCNTVSPDKER